MKDYFIYILLMDGVAFYIGVTEKPEKRLSHHKLRYGDSLKMEIKEKYTGSKTAALLLEDFWVYKYADMGIVLKNKNTERSLTRRCKFCNLELQQKQGKKVKEFCNNTCRSNFWYAKNKKVKPDSTIDFKATAAKSYDGGKLPENFVDDEPLNFERIRQQLPEKTTHVDFYTELRNAESLEELNAIGMRIKASSLSWKDQQPFHAFGQQMAEKFI